MIVLIVAFDRITKYLAKAYLQSGAVTFIKGFVQFRYAENTGMAFSMFSGARWIFVIITVAICAAGLWYLFSNRCPNLWYYWSVGVIVAGGIGNLIDRALYGYVVDFIEPLFVDFAIFNVADCAVTCGAAVLIGALVFDLFRERKNGKN
jgi:signal peptidase II